MRLLAIILLLGVFVHAKGWQEHNASNTFTSSISYFATTDKRAGMLLDLSYNFHSFMIGLKQTDSYRQSFSETTPYLGYYTHNIELSLGYGWSKLYTTSYETKDYFLNYTVRYYPWPFMHIGLEQHVYERADIPNIFLFNVGFTYTRAWSDGFP